MQKKYPVSDDFGLRSPVILGTFWAQINVIVFTLYYSSEGWRLFDRDGVLTKLSQHVRAAEVGSPGSTADQR